MEILQEKRIVVEQRASVLLYRFLLTKKINNTILLPANICSIIPLLFQSLKIKTRYIDINTDDYCIDYNQVLDLIKNEPQKYGGLLFVHTYGIEKTPIPFYKIIKELNPDFLIIDDRCLCTPEFIATEYADLTLYSTGYAKYIDLGYGGYGYFNNENLKRIYNIKLDEKTFLSSNKIKLPKEKFIDIVNKEKESISIHKKKINQLYSSYLTKITTLDNGLNNWRYNIITNNSDELLKFIFDNGFFASKHYKPINSSFTNSNNLYNNVINLFNDRYISIKQAEQLANLINKYITK